MLRGWAKVMEGQCQDGIREVKDGSTAWRATGSKFQVTFRLVRAAEACLVAGAKDEGLRLTDETLERSGDAWFLSEGHRIKGELLQLSLQTDNVEGCFREALKVANEQGARLLELRAAMSLARLWRDRGKTSEARELLAPVYGWFAEGFDTRDLKEAKALLEELTT